MCGGEWAEKERSCPCTISGGGRDDGTEFPGAFGGLEMCLLSTILIISPMAPSTPRSHSPHPHSHPRSTCTHHQPLWLLTWLLSWASAWVAVGPCPPEAAPSRGKQQGTWVRAWQKPGTPNSPASETFQGTEPHGPWEGPWVGRVVLSGQQSSHCSQ